MTEIAAERTDVAFPSDGVTCRGWLYRPRQTTDAPCVVMAHGFSLTCRDGLSRYAEELAAAGVAVLVFDHRHIGESDGNPRQYTSVNRQLTDRRSAIAYARGLPGIDPNRIVLWGFSMSALTAVLAAVDDPDIAGLILLCPVLDARTRTLRALRMRPVNTLWVTWHVVKDLVDRRTMIPATAQPPEYGTLALPGESDGFASAVAADSLWRNEVWARSIATLPFCRPITKAARIGCPVLLQQGLRDISVVAADMDKFARRAPRTELLRYDADHFQPFYDDGVLLRITADQADWLSRTVI